MAASKYPLGTVFEVPLVDGTIGYLQSIAHDKSMLDSTVVRVFQGVVKKSFEPTVQDIVSREIQFYAHVFLNACIKFGFWRKVGIAPYPNNIQVVFRASWDDGDPSVTVSNRWYVWRVNDTFLDVGTLPREYYNAELGCVLSPQMIAKRMETGEFGMSYVSF